MRYFLSFSLLFLIQWGGDRDRRHSTILVQAMIRRGMLHGAWQALLITGIADAPLMSVAYKELLIQVLKLLSGV